MTLKVIPANDVVGATIALGEALAGNGTVFICGPEIAGVKPEIQELPTGVSNTALIIESSGSTGTPKRIQLSKEALLASAKATEEYFGTSGQWLLALPINYIAGAQVLIRSLVAETQPIVMNTLVSFTPEAFARSAQLMTAEHRFTSLVPTQLKRLAEVAELDESLLRALKSFTAILVGGQAVDPGMVASLRDKGVNLVLSYGMAETAGGVVYDGKTLSGVEVSIRDGLIAIKSPSLANGVANESGFLVSKDAGEFVDGTLKVLGRADRVLISGALKVSLDSVEAVAGSIGGVVEVAATALESVEWGQRVGLVYVGSPEVADYVAGAVFEQLGLAAKPIRVIRVDKLPRLVSGKTDLVGVRKLFDV
jgi:O-succinylbenzoic acid--CoA ligase